MILEVICWRYIESLVWRVLFFFLVEVWFSNFWRVLFVMLEKYDRSSLVEVGDLIFFFIFKFDNLFLSVRFYVIV